MADGTESAVDTHDVHRWPTTAKRKGVVFFQHGYGYHQMAFKPFYEIFNAHGYEVISNDALCHGRSKIPLNSDTVVDAGTAAAKLFDDYAHERPILFGIGTFGGYIMRRIVEARMGTDYVPPAIYMSVEYVQVPWWLLKRMDHPWLLRFFDKFKAGYDYRLLTHDPEDDARFVESDPLIQRTFAIGCSLQIGLKVNRFYDAPPMKESRHAFLIGSEDKLSELGPVRKCAARQPDYGLFVVEGAAFHLHREKDPVLRQRFDEQLDAALEFVSQPPLTT